jgi:hypothetical protein
LVGLKSALPPEWADRMLANFEVLYAEAEQQDLSGQIGHRGRVPRGPGEEPRRYYFAVHPERLSGFVDLVTHPVLDAVCRNVLSDDYQFVEVGFDVALPGAVTQPLHRDFPIPEETKATGRLSSPASPSPTSTKTPDEGSGHRWRCSKSQASATMSLRSGLRGFHPSSSRIRALEATSAAGSPARLPSSALGMSRPVTDRAASGTSRTEYPAPLPRL